MQFIPGIYKSIYNTALGQDLWAFLQTPEILIRLERACELDQPALKAMGRFFNKEFNNILLNDFHKQMIGAMVRQLLESRGYQFVRGNQSFRNDPVFASSARYCFI